jgi:hypothetical protein
MSHGLPVIALDDLAVRSPIQHEVNGLKVPDADAFAEACVRLWRERDVAQRLGTAARTTVQESFGPERLPVLLSQAIERARDAARVRQERNEEQAGPLRRFLAAESDWALQGRRIAIYGAGSLGRTCHARLGEECDVVAFVDSDKSKDGTHVEGVAVIAPARLRDADVDLVVVASMYWPQILNHLDEHGWDADRVRVF